MRLSGKVRQVLGPVYYHPSLVSLFRLALRHFVLPGDPRMHTHLCVYSKSFYPFKIRGASVPIFRIINYFSATHIQWRFNRFKPDCRTPSQKFLWTFYSLSIQHFHLTLTHCFHDQPTQTNAANAVVTDYRASN